MLKMHERLLTVAVAACALSLCAGPVFAALAVEMIQPDTDPFTSMVDNPAYFEAIAYIDGQELPGGEVTWDWDFGDQTAHSTDDPTTHTFTEVGEYTVMVTASYGGQQGQDTAIAIVEEPEPSPGGGSISIYVAHDGMWLSYRTQEYEEAEIEDFVAVFTPPEQITDDPDVWADHQINDPQIPAGWLFFEAASPMELHIVIRDTEDRLGEVVVTDRYTQELVGTLEADPLGSEIDGRLSVDPTAEAFNLNVKDKEGATLILAAADKAEVNDAVAAMHVYIWEANSGDEHAGCPADPQPPWGNPADATGRETLPDGSPPAVRTACCGRNEFNNDKATEGVERPQYKLYEKDRLRDETKLPDDLDPDAADAVQAQIKAAQDMFPVAQTAIHPAHKVPPYSRGVLHFTANVDGRVAAVVYVAYRSKTVTKFVIGPLIQGQVSEAAPAGGGSGRPSHPWAAGVTFTREQEKKWRILGKARPAGEVWGLYASSPAVEDEGISGITTPITFTLTTDIPGGPISGTGTAEVDTAWTTPSPPPVMESPLDLTFGQDGTCTVDLAKGWKWKAKGRPGEYYSEGTVGPFNVASQATKTIVCHLQVLLCLKIKTVSEGGENVEATVQLERHAEGEWWPEDSGQSTEQPNGEYIWSPAKALAPGGYRARATGMGPWSDWLMMNITIGLEDTKTITVPQEQEP